MKKNTQTKNSQVDYKTTIHKIIMATDAILHIDWEDKLAFYIQEHVENEKEKASQKTKLWYTGLIVLLSVIFIGWYCIYGRCNHKHFDEIQNIYNSETCKKDTSKIGRIIVENQQFNVKWKKTAKK